MRQMEKMGNKMTYAEHNGWSLRVNVMDEEAKKSVPAELEAYQLSQ